MLQKTLSSQQSRLLSNTMQWNLFTNILTIAYPRQSYIGSSSILATLVHLLCFTYQLESIHIQVYV